MDLKTQSEHSLIADDQVVEGQTNLQEWSVSTLSVALKKLLHDQFSYVRVRGEISGYRGPHKSNGHAYFTLKEEGYSLNAIVWKGVMTKLRVRLEEGIEVIASGKITSYPERSVYQLIIDDVVPTGVGAWLALFEKRRLELIAQGVFETPKKSLPFLPKRIAIVTSLDGVVFRDIYRRLLDRFMVSILIYPVRVQGVGAAKEIAQAIRILNSLPETFEGGRPDVLVVARGGGSLEDLWAFNEDEVVYAIRDSVIPVVSAIGHETDVTLADFVADVRASTPTAAALYVVPVRADLINATESYAIRLCSAMCGLLRHHHQLYYHLQARLPSQAFQFVDHRKHLKRIEHVLKTSFLIALSQHERHAQMLITRLHKHSPLNLLHYQRTRVAHDWSMLTILVLKHMGNRKLDLNQYARGLTYVFVQTQQRVRHTIRMQRQHLDSLWKGCERRFGYVIETRIEWLSRAQDLLMTLNVEGLLARGFSLVKNAEGAYCSRKQSITLGECLTVRFIDGELKAKVIDLGEPTFDREG